MAQEGGDFHFHSVSAINASEAWILSHQQLKRTTDGGATWTSLGELSPHFDLKIEFFNSNQGWALTDRVAYVTSDGGATWTSKLQSPAGTELNVGSFISPTTGWVVTIDDVLYKTIDGGTTWSQSQLPPGNPMTVKFANANTGWIAIAADPDYATTILKTADGGATWQVVWSVPKFGPYVHDISAVGNTHAWFISGGNSILRTTDGGGTFLESEILLVESFLVGMHFADTTHGWLIGDKVHYSEDGGATWTIQPALKHTYYHDVTFVNPTTGWIVGSQGLILKTVNGGQP